jgi:hypothetical protein
LVLPVGADGKPYMRHTPAESNELTAGAADYLVYLSIDWKRCVPFFLILITSGIFIFQKPMQIQKAEIFFLDQSGFLYHIEK